MDSYIKLFYFLLSVLSLAHNSKTDYQIYTEAEVAEAESYLDEEPRRIGSWINNFGMNINI